MNEFERIMLTDTLGRDTPLLDTRNGMQLEQSKDSCSRNIKLKLTGEPLDLFATDSDTRWYQYKQNENRFNIQNNILVRAYYDNVGEISHFQILLPK